jgi:predicted permease
MARSAGRPAADVHQSLIAPSGVALPWSIGLRGRTVRWLLALPRRLAKLLRRVFIPSVLGITIGGIVGLFGKTLVLPPETAPLGWLFISATKLGEAAVPINLVLLGAALSRRPDARDLPALTAVRTSPTPSPG